MRYGRLLSATLLLPVLTTLSAPVAWGARASKPAAKKPAAPAAPAGVDAAQKGSVQDAKLKLGELPPWQAAVFDAEIVPQYKRFVRGYRQSGDNITVDVDLDSIRKYLGFAPSKGGADGKPELRMAAFVAADPACDRCKDAVEEVKKSVKGRIERRGFKAVWLAPEEAGGGYVSWPEMVEKGVETARSKGMAGAMMVQVSLAPVDAIDTAHADERKFVARSLVMSLPQGATPEMKAEGSLEALENDSLALAAENVLTDALTEIGARALAAASAGDPSEAKAEELVLLFRGVGDFTHYTLIKNQVREALKDVGPVEERKSARGMMAFGVRTRRSPDELKALLNSVGDGGGRPLQLEIQ